MGFHDQAAVYMPKWSELNCSSGNVFSIEMNHTTLSGSLMDESRFGIYQYNATYSNA